jgi:hypothetical protein
MIIRVGAALAIILSTAVWLSRFPQPLSPRSPQRKLPVYFIPNQGQVDTRVAYYVQGRRAAAYFTPAGVTYALSESKPFRPASFSPRRQAWVQLDFLDANPQPRIEPLHPTGATVSYFRGESHQWKEALPTYNGILYRNLWPGIDLEFASPDGALKYTFHLRPGADPRQIRFAYRGATAINLTAAGSLHIETPLGSFTDEKPIAWQDAPSGRRPVPVAFHLQGDQLRFDLGTCDPRLPLTIDPVVLLYAGFLGGAEDDRAYAIAIDSAGNSYVAGGTSSTETTFPVVNGPTVTHQGNDDAFVAKINPSGSALVYAGFLGGAGYDLAWGIAVDATGSAYLAGATSSDQTTFPVTVGPDLTHNGNFDGFVAKIHPSGASLVYVGYLGGADIDEARAIAVDSAGHAYVTGYTASSQATFPVAVGPDLTYNGEYDAFVAKIHPSGASLVNAGYLGGDSSEQGTGIAVDPQGSAYLTGNVFSSEATFPATVGPDLTYNGTGDAFVAKVHPSGASLVYAGYVGGDGTEFGRAIAVDAAGQAYLAGDTWSNQATFPVTVGPDLTYNGSGDAFVAKVHSSGANLLYAGYVGGAATDSGFAIAVDAAANAYLAGSTYSNQATFPVTIGPDLTFNGASDAFVTKIHASGASLVYSSYLGGAAADEAYAIVTDTAGNAYLAGQTFSSPPSFPVTIGPDLTFNGSRDSFVAKLSAFPSTAGPVMALRNGFNAIETSTFPSPAVRNAGGNFRLNPVLALSPSGRAFLVGRDSAVGVWINTLNPDETYTGWLFAGGNSPGQPALAVAGETAWIAVRDPWNSYYVRTHNPASGFGSWTWLQGILATDPQIAACPNGDVYVTGRDSFNGVWTRRYRASAFSWQAWRFIGGIITGTPAIACGADNAAYVAARDPSNNMWLARVFEESSATWNYGAGIFQGDLQIAAHGNLIHVFGLAANVPWYRTWLVGTGWQGWTSPGGVLTHFAPAVYGSHVFLTGQDASGSLWWWSSLGNSWRNFGSKNVAPGSAFSAGAR